tara:strand:- start:34830 stop:35984 length:1155 start_codon:yes stop_codon:yes gene_type:complete
VKRRKCYSILLTFLFLINNYAYPKDKTYTLSGFIIDESGDKVPSAQVLLFSEDGEEIGETNTGKRFGGKGKFKFKKLSQGKYTIKASQDGYGTGIGDYVIIDDDLDIELTLLPGLGEVAAGGEFEEGISESGETPEDVVRMVEDEYVLSEMSFEMKKVNAEVSHLGSEIRELKAKSEMWTNPLSVYSKEIILGNGSTVFGKVVYQDEDILKVETLIGYLVINRDQVVRIIENVVGQEEPEYIPEQIRETYSPPPVPKLTKPQYTSAHSTERMPGQKRAANVVLVGNISETKDRSNNISLSGQLKNIGGNRADFVKMNFVFRKNWSGETKTLTSFVRGAYHTFESGITTDSSLLPGASGSFELVIPADFGPFIGYSYVIDWEEYE